MDGESRPADGNSAQRKTPFGAHLSYAGNARRKLEKGEYKGGCGIGKLKKGKRTLDYSEKRAKENDECADGHHACGSACDGVCENARKPH